MRKKINELVPGDIIITKSNVVRVVLCLNFWASGNMCRLIFLSAEYYFHDVKKHWLDYKSTKSINIL